MGPAVRPTRLPRLSACPFRPTAVCWWETRAVHRRSSPELRWLRPFPGEPRLFEPRRLAFTVQVHPRAYVPIYSGAHLPIFAGPHVQVEPRTLLQARSGSCSQAFIEALGGRGPPAPVTWQAKCK